MINIGIVGLGHMGGYHASVVTTLPNLRLVGVADPHQKNLDKVTLPGVIKTNHFMEWIDLVDAVIIAVQTNNHYTVAKAFLERGKHVLVEKPLTKVFAEAQELFAIAEKNNVALHIGHVERFNGAIQELKKIIKDPLLIECHRMGPFVARAARDSVVLDLMIHDIDLVLNLVNETPIKISAHGTKVDSASCDVATAQLTFPSGCVASIIASRASQVKKRTMAVHQKNATLNLDFGTQDLMIHRQASSSVQVGSDQLQYRQESLIEHVFVYKDNPLKLEIMHFINAIQYETERRSARQDLQALGIIFEIERQLGLRPDEIPFAGKIVPSFDSPQQIAG
jgi:predicted dehydrogenase